MPNRSLCLRALRRSACRHANRTSQRSFASAASGSFQYESGETAGVKYASRDLPWPTTTVSVVARAGTRYQPYPGLSDALEKFAFKSTAKRSALRITRETEMLGGELSAYHSRESLVLRSKFLREDLPYFTELLGEIISKPRFSPHELDEDVIRVMRLEHRKLLASPQDLALNSAHGLAFHRGLGAPLYPTSSSPFNKYLDSETIASFAASAYAKPNIAVVANGADHGEFSKWVAEFFKDTFDGKAKLESPQSKYYGGEERIAHAASNVMVLAFPGSSAFSSGSSFKPELSVLATLLGGESSIKWSSGFSLFSKLADKLPHVHVQTQQSSYSDAGLLHVVISGPANQVSQASQSIVETVKKIAAGEISAEDIKKATALAKFRALEAGHQIDAGIEATGAGLITGGKAHQIDEVGRAIDNVKEAQIKQAAKALLESKATVSTVGDLHELPFAEDIGLKV